VARKVRSSLLAPADVDPLDVDGVRTVAIGTIIWALAFVVLLPYADDLRRSDAQWWLWTCLTGVGFGLVGVAYCVWRRSRIRRARAGTTEDETTPGQSGS
jgi:hypothetical protein